MQGREQGGARDPRRPRDWRPPPPWRGWSGLRRVQSACDPTLSPPSCTPAGAFPKTSCADKAAAGRRGPLQPTQAKQASLVTPWDSTPPCPSPVVGAPAQGRVRVLLATRTASEDGGAAPSCSPPATPASPAGPAPQPDRVAGKEIP